MDDCLLNHPDSVILVLHRDFTRHLLHLLGLVVSKAKSELIPYDRLQFIGDLFQTDLDLTRPRDDTLSLQLSTDVLVLSSGRSSGPTISSQAHPGMSHPGQTGWLIPRVFPKGFQLVFQRFG